MPKRMIFVGIHIDFGRCVLAGIVIRSQPPSQRQFHAKTHDFRRYLHRFWAMRTCWDRMSSFFFRVSKNKHRRTRHEFSRGHNLNVKPMYPLGT